MGKTQRERGKRGERELAAILREHGYEARRGQQYCGTNGDADVVGLPGIHIECKRTERVRLYTALAQSNQDARDGEVPVVISRADRKPWVVTLSLDDFLDLLESALRNNT